MSPELSATLNETQSSPEYPGITKQENVKYPVPHRQCSLFTGSWKRAKIGYGSLAGRFSPPPAHAGWQRLSRATHVSISFLMIAPIDEPRTG